MLQFEIALGQWVADKLRFTNNAHDSRVQAHADCFSGLGAAVLASAGVLIALGAAMLARTADPRASIVPIAMLAMFAFGFSHAGYTFARRAPHVTWRFLRVAKCALVISIVGLALSFAPVAITVARMFQ